MSKKRTAWVLDTETKGTGAEMVPLERLEKRKRRADKRQRIRVIGPKGEAPAAAAEPDGTPGPRRFKVVSVLSRQVLAEDVGISDALDALRQVGSVVDANVYVWEHEEEDWRPLTMSERRALWGFRNSGSPQPA